MSVQLTNFLRKENKMLKQENQELKELLELNRTALKVAAHDEKKQNNFPTLIKLLYEQNSKLHKKIDSLKIQLQTGMCQALISQQIAFASTEQQKNLTSQLRDKLTKMRRELEQRQRKIVQLSKQNIEDKTEVKIIEITEMNTLTKKLKDQIIDLNNEVDNKKQEAIKYKQQKEELLKLNLVLTKQINQLKIISSLQSTGSNDYSHNQSSGDLSKFMNYQKKIVAEDDDDSQDYEQYSQDSSQLSSDLQIDESMYSNNIEVSTKNKAPKLEMHKIPKLELSKAKQIQDLIVQKINEDGKKKNGTIKQEKYRKIEQELAQARKKIGVIIIQKIQLQKQNSFLTKIVKELESRNQLLLNNSEANLDKKLSSSSRDIQETQTLIDICRDVTLNRLLKDVINGEAQLPYYSHLKSYDI